MNKRLARLAAACNVGLAFAVFFVLPRIAAAAPEDPPQSSSWWDLSNWFYNVVVGSGFKALQWIAFTIGYLVATAGALAFSIEAFLLDFVIRINFEIVRSPTVEVGFSIILAFANILLVAAIIAMAVATIVRYNPYGAKQLLFKIVIAAVGVNFSLVLAGTVMAFSDQVSLYFLNASIPASADPAMAAAKGDLRVAEFADQLAGTFQPQRAFELTGKSKNAGIGLLNKGTGNQAATDLIGAVMGVLITAFTVISMAIFLGVLVAAFLVRYLWLGLLLMLMPGVWIAWIFPFSKSYVGQWMNKFIKWTFFAPVTLFFLYLGMRISEVFSQTTDIQVSGNNVLGKEINGLFGELATGIMNNLLGAMLIGGTLWAGLFLASSMGIGLATTGMKAMEATAGSIRRRTVGRAVTGAKNAGLRRVDRIRGAGKDALGRSYLQRQGSKLAVLGSGSRIGNTVTSVLGIKAAGRALADAGAVDKKNFEERSKQYKDQYASMTSEALQTRLRRVMSGSLLANPDEERAIVELLAEKKGLGKVHKVENAEGKEYTSQADKEKHEQRLRDLMKRATQDGHAETILKNNPLMAKYAPPSKIKTNDGKKDKKTGKDMERDATQAEMIGNALKTVDREGAKAVIANPDLFGDAKLEKPTPEQIWAVLNLRSSVLNDMIQDGGNPETVQRIMDTMDYINEARETPEALRTDEQKKLFKKIAYDENTGKSDINKEGYGVTEAQLTALAAKERTLAKNIQSLAYAEQNERDDADTDDDKDRKGNDQRSESQKNRDRMKERDRQRRARRARREAEVGKKSEAGASSAAQPGLPFDVDDASKRP